MNNAYFFRETAIIDDGSAVNVITYIQALKNTLVKKSIKNMMNIQPRDVIITNSEGLSLQNYFRFSTNTKINFGVSEFVKWNTEYYKC